MTDNTNAQDAPIAPSEAADDTTPNTLGESAAPVDRVTEIEAQLVAERDRALRLAADMDNLRKRSRKEVEDALVRGRAEVLVETLPVADSIDLALNAPGVETSSAAAVLEGLAMIRKQFLAAVERFGVKPVEAVGKSFDPNLHEAVAQVHSDEHGVGCVVHEMRRGYVLGEKLLRPSMVVVSKGSLEDKPEVATVTGESEHLEE